MSWGFSHSHASQLGDQFVWNIYVKFVIVFLLSNGRRSSQFTRINSSFQSKSYWVIRMTWLAGEIAAWLSEAPDKRRPQL